MNAVVKFMLDWWDCIFSFWAGLMPKRWTIRRCKAHRTRGSRRCRRRVTDEDYCWQHRPDWPPTSNPLPKPPSLPPGPADTSAGTTVGP